MKTIFKIPGILPGMNDIINTARTHWISGKKQKKQFTDYCGYYILASRIPIFNYPVKVKFKWYERNRKRDRDNITAGAKFVFDALVETGRLKNDSEKWVKEISHDFPEPDSVNPRIEVTIEEYENRL